MRTQLYRCFYSAKCKWTNYLKRLLDVTGGARIDNVQIGIYGGNEIDTASGNLTIDSAGGTTTIDDALTVSGATTLTGALDANGGASIDNVQIGVSGDNEIILLQEI